MSDFELIVKIGKVDAVMRKLQAMQGFRTGTKTAFVHLKSKIAHYPPQSSRPQSQYWSALQRRAFFAKLKSGEIVVPYPRGLAPSSERLGQRWAIRGEGFGMSLSNNASYASRVQGSMQTNYHKKTGWIRVDTAIREETPAMGRIIYNEIQKDLKA